MEMANLVKLRKGNRVINVDAQFLNNYLLRGYDQIDNDGKVIRYATGGKTVQINEYNKVVTELKELKEQLQKPAVDENEYKKLVEELKEAHDYIKQLEKENEKLTKQLQKR